VAASKRLADELANARECAAYIGKHCPESMALCDPKPGTVLPLEYEEAIQAERKVVSLDAVRKKVANDASLARSLQGYVLFLQQREQLESEAFHWAKAVASMIVSYGWGGPNAIDPFLALDAPINPKASFDAAAPLHETARAQAQRFNIYVQGMNGAVGAAD